MQIGKLYNVVFSTGRYEITYENGVKCINKTPKSYRVERSDGTTRLVATWRKFFRPKSGSTIKSGFEKMGKG